LNSAIIKQNAEELLSRPLTFKNNYGYVIRHAANEKVMAVISMDERLLSLCPSSSVKAMQWHPTLHTGRNIFLIVKFYAIQCAASI